MKGADYFFNPKLPLMRPPLRAIGLGATKRLATGLGRLNVLMGLAALILKCDGRAACRPRAPDGVDCRPRAPPVNLSEVSICGFDIRGVPEVSVEVVDESLFIPL
mmetsp:Transcript_56984/g.68202  ORF Transcript_56984/g.68202 Transcript_56984/m.68202 type:complete len:105 (+) Transcript_56984:339-653(+)